jgi:hypothetical protein
MKINLNNTPYTWNKNTKTFSMSEKDVRFATEYEIFNPKTGGSKDFKFTHATGPEFDPNTKWIYSSFDGFVLEVCNDAKITKQRAADYVAAKTRY